MKSGDILTPELKRDLDKIQALKELALSLANMRLIPLRNELDKVDKSDKQKMAAIEMELQNVEADFTKYCKEIEYLCNKHDLKYRIISARYTNPLN